MQMAICTTRNISGSQRGSFRRLSEGAFMLAAARRLLFKMRQFAKNLKALFNLFALQRLQPLGPKPFHRKRPHDSAVEQCPLQNFAIDFFLRSDVTHKSARKRISRPGRVLHFIDWQSWRAKGVAPHTERPFPKENRRAKIGRA